MSSLLRNTRQMCSMTRCFSMTNVSNPSRDSTAALPIKEWALLTWTPGKDNERECRKCLTHTQQLRPYPMSEGQQLLHAEVRHSLALGHPIEAERDSCNRWGASGARRGGSGASAARIR